MLCTTFNMGKPSVRFGGRGEVITPRSYPYPVRNRISTAQLLRQNFLEEGDCAFIVRLPKPKHRVFAHRWIFVGSRNLDEFGDAVVFWQLAQSKDGLLFHVGLSIVLNILRNC